MTYTQKRSKKRNINRRLGYKQSNKLNRTYKQYGGAEDYNDAEDYDDNVSVSDEEAKITPEQKEQKNDEEFSKASEALEIVCKKEDEELQELLYDYEDDIATLNRLYDGDLTNLVEINTHSQECSEMLSVGIKKFSDIFFKKIEEVKSLTETIKDKNDKILEDLNINEYENAVEGGNL